MAERGAGAAGASGTVARQAGAAVETADATAMGVGMLAAGPCCMVKDTCWRAWRKE